MKRTGTPNERVYILEVAQRPILAFVAARFSEALELGREQWLRGDLRRRTSGGTPIWDGKTRISIRGATPDEIAGYASRSSETDVEDELGIVYIVTLDSKT
jgi:hypothetical protein